MDTIESRIIAFGKLLGRFLIDWLVVKSSMTPKFRITPVPWSMFGNQCRYKSEELRGQLL